MVWGYLIRSFSSCASLYWTNASNRVLVSHMLLGTKAQKSQAIKCHDAPVICKKKTLTRENWILIKHAIHPSPCYYLFMCKLIRPWVCICIVLCLKFISPAIGLGCWTLFYLIIFYNKFTTAHLWNKLEELRILPKMRKKKDTVSSKTVVWYTV